MALLHVTSASLPVETLNALHDAVSAATDPDRLDGASPYHSTFWFDLASAPTNLVARVVLTELRNQVPEFVRKKTVGVEWWLGRLTAPYATNFEFGAHRDFGENPETGALESPMLSSVFYLTTVDDGPLTVFPGAPNMADDDKEFVFPRANSYAMFPGHLWHMVGSAAEVTGEPAAPDNRVRLTVLINWWAYRPGGEATAPMKLVAADYDGTIYPELRT